MKQIDNIKRIVQQAESITYHESAEECEHEMCSYSLSELSEEWLELEMNYAALIEVVKTGLR